MEILLLLLFKFSHRCSEIFSKLLKALMFQLVFRTLVFMHSSESTQPHLIIELLRRIIIIYNSKLLLRVFQSKKGYRLLDSCILKLNFKKRTDSQFMLRDTEYHCLQQEQQKSQTGDSQLLFEPIWVWRLKGTSSKERPFAGVRQKQTTCLIGQTVPGPLLKKKKKAGWLPNICMPSLPGMHRLHLVLTKSWGKTREIAMWGRRTKEENTGKENWSQYRNRKELWDFLPYFL